MDLSPDADLAFGHSLRVALRNKALLSILYVAGIRMPNGIDFRALGSRRALRHLAQTFLKSALELKK